MEKKELFTLEFGSGKNGVTGFLLKDINALLLEWKGDILFEEFMQIIDKGFEEVAKYKLTSWTGDTSLMNTPDEETMQYVATKFPERAVKAGIKKFAIVLPADAMGEIFVQEAMENLKNTPEDRRSPMESFFTTNISEAIGWIK